MSTEPRKIIRESADDLDQKRIDDLTKGILDSFRFAKVKPLESLSVALQTFDMIAKNMLDNSVHGKFESNKEGILHVLEQALVSLRAYKSPKGYIMGPGDLPPAQV